MIRDIKPYSILIIEDNPGDFVIVKELLLEHVERPMIIRANNFKQAKEILIDPSNHFDVILLDLSLPDNSGSTLIQDMLRFAGSSPVIILTGFEDIDFSIRSIGLGISDYLLKDTLNSFSLYKSIIYTIERMRTNLELRKSKKQYSDLFHLSPQPMYVIDPITQKFEQVNDAAINLYGYTEKEFLSLNVSDIVVEVVSSQMLEGQINNVFGESTTSEEIHKKKFGEIIEVEIYSNPIVINQKTLRSVIAIDNTEKKNYESSITKAIIKTQEDERYEIGEELHDNVCQILATSKLSLGMLKHSFTNLEDVYFNQANEYISLALKEIRNLSHRLAPSFFDETTLKDSFQKLINDFNVEQKYKIDFEFNVSVKEYDIDHELQLNLYRILQEQLRNIFKYAKASHIQISIKSNSQITMKIIDDGIGFSLDMIKTGIGMANMKRRTEVFSGKFEVLSSPGKGCSVTITIPLTK